MENIFTYNPSKDKSPVIAGLACDINQALETGTIADTGIDCEYQGTDDMEVSSVGSRVDDQFQAMNNMRAIAQAAKASNTNVKIVEP